LNVGNQQPFTATGKDQFGTDFPLTNPQWTTTGGGTLDPTTGSTTTFTATIAGDYEIRCQEGSVYGTGTVTIANPPPVLTTIEVTPSTANLQVGDTQPFAAVGKDQYGADYPLTSPVWSVYNPPGTTGDGTFNPGTGTTTSFRATAAGDCEVRCQEQGVRGVAIMHIAAPGGRLVRILVTPRWAILYPGRQQQFAAEGYDRNDQEIPLTNPQWSTTGGGTLIPNGSQCTYTATTIGNYTITCEEPGVQVQGTADIEVIQAPPALSGIVVTPVSATMEVGRIEQFRATGTDQYGDPIALTDPIWTTSGGGTIVPNGSQCIYTATTTGNYTITCTEGGSNPPIHDTADIVVVNTRVEDQIENLMARVEDLVAAGLLNRGNGNALVSKLRNALKRLDKGNEKAAVNQINAFINQVRAFINSGKLPEEEGQILIDIASNIIKDLT